MCEKLIAGDLVSANAMIASVTSDPAAIRVDIADNRRTAEAAPVWRIDAPGQSRIRFHPASWKQHPRIIFERCIATLPMLSFALRQLEHGWCSLNLGDTGHRPGLAFCDNRPDYTLIPDAVFLMTDGYRDLKRAFERDRPWKARVPYSFWRGALTGARDPDGDVTSIERVRLCRLGQRLGSIVDFGLTDLLGASEAEQAKLRDLKLVRDYIPVEDFDRYQLHIDIDGHSNSWPGLMAKLLSGGTVLKVASGKGYRQWYYGRLEPWVHYVPVRNDLADLAERIDQMQADPASARAIGARGRELARTMIS